MSVQTQIIVALLFLLSLGGYLFYKEIESHAQTRTELAIKEQAIENIEQSIKDAKALQIITEQKVNDLVNETSSNRRKLSELSGREATVVAKPGLVEIKLNKAFDRTQHKLGCVTGDTKLCK